jgi:hypothetical protein
MIFLAAYPSGEVNREGMFQRIGSIDDLFREEQRVYISYSLFRNFFKKKCNINASVFTYNVNFFIHFFLILSLLRKEKRIYVHSLYNSLPILFISTGCRKIILDFHGTVPEELQFEGKLLKSFLYSILERLVVKKFTAVVFVTNAMKSYYHTKYKILKTKESIIYPILSRQLFVNESFNKKEFLKDIEISESDVVFIYSGNLQKWQNFNLVIDMINKTTNKNYKFIILSGEVDKARTLLMKTALYPENLIIKSVDSSELYKYYSVSHYGIILRDDHILNRVACPTKLVEYLYYGLIPIVKYDGIGDFLDYGYEFLHISKYSNNLSQQSSNINKNIIDKLLNKNSDQEIIDYFS